MNIHDSSPLAKPHVDFAGGKTGEGIQGSRSNRQLTLTNNSNLAKINAEVVRQSEVRKDVIETIKQRIVAGEFDTVQAALATAESILGNV